MTLVLCAIFLVLGSTVVCADLGRLILLHSALNEGAACLDGTAPAYYFIPGNGTGVNKWYVHHEGGGWCTSIADCYSRSLTGLGSSTNYTITLNLDVYGGYFSSDPTVNSLMYNWNKVFFAYCDGGSFAGNNDTVTFYNGYPLHFKGFRNLKAYKKDLDLNRNFRKATDVVISGCSAGGLATYLHLDWWRENIISRTKVIGLPDSGFFLDYEAGPAYGSKMRWVFQQMNCSDGVNQRCIRANKGGDLGSCFFAEHTATHIMTPYFPQQATYDTWQIGNVLGSNNTSAVNTFGELLKQRFIDAVITNKVNGGFLDSCAHHCWSWNDIVINNKDITQAFQLYYNTVTSGQFYNQDRPYPCNACCKRGQ